MTPVQHQEHEAIQTILVFLLAVPSGRKLTLSPDLSWNVYISYTASPMSSLGAL